MLSSVSPAALSGNVSVHGSSSLPHAELALHHFLTSLWGQGHESEQQVKVRNSGFWGGLV